MKPSFKHCLPKLLTILIADCSINHLDSFLQVPLATSHQCLEDLPCHRVIVECVTFEKGVAIGILAKCMGFEVLEFFKERGGGLMGLLDKGGMVVVKVGRS